MYRVPGGFAFGFSPFTRALFKIAGNDEIVLRIAVALAAILLWVAMEGGGFAWSFFLLPLTFYGFVPWEHALSWLLLWPAVWTFLVKEKLPIAAVVISGVSAALAILLRPETILLAMVLCAYLLIRKEYWRGFFFAGAGVLGIAALTLVHSVTSQQPLWVQLSLNAADLVNSPSWWSVRLSALYGLLFMMDRTVLISVGMLLLFIVSSGIIFRSERRRHKPLFAMGLVLLAGWTILYQYRLWSHPLPPLALMGANSLLACLPWVMVLARPPYRGRPALFVAVAAILLALLLTPVWRGVHWGPRILLFALPLFVIDLHRTERARGWLFTSLLALTFVQTAASGVIAYARNEELAQCNRGAAAQLGSIVVCSSQPQCADLAPLWKDREFFTASDPRKIRQLLIEFRRIGLDTCWLHLGTHDRIFTEAFPASTPVQLESDTVIGGGCIYKRQWRIEELLLNRADTSWAQVLQSEAGVLLKERRTEEALRLQREAVESSPESAQTHHNLALIYSALNQGEKALAEVQRALELDSSLTVARRLQEDLFQRIGGVLSDGKRQ
jgi:hypothetical protein